MAAFLALAAWASVADARERRLPNALLAAMAAVALAFYVALVIVFLSAFDITLTLRPEDGYTGASLSVQRYDRTEKETTGTTFLFWEIAALEVAS